MTEYCVTCGAWIQSFAVDQCDKCFDNECDGIGPDALADAERRAEEAQQRLNDVGEETP